MAASLPPPARLLPLGGVAALLCALLAPVAAADPLPMPPVHVEPLDSTGCLSLPGTPADGACIPFALLAQEMRRLQTPIAGPSQGAGGCVPGTLLVHADVQAQMTVCASASSSTSALFCIRFESGGYGLGIELFPDGPAVWFPVVVPFAVTPGIPHGSSEGYVGAKNGC